MPKGMLNAYSPQKIRKVFSTKLAFYYSPVRIFFDGVSPLCIVSALVFRFLLNFEAWTSVLVLEARCLCTVHACGIRIAFTHFIIEENSYSKSL